MASRVKINSKFIGASPVEAGLLNTFLTTQSCDVKGTINAANSLGGVAYTSKLLSVFAPDSVVEIHEKPEGKSEEKLVARYTLQNIVNRMVAATTANERAGEIFPYEVKESTGKKSVESTPIGSWLESVEAE